MKNVLFTGFFGMTAKHAGAYIRMWEKLGHKVDYQPYTHADVLLAGGRFEKIRSNVRLNAKHYDVAYCISGGSLHMHNLLMGSGARVDRVIFDSGPYLFSSKHIEHYVQATTGVNVPLYGIIHNFYQVRGLDLEEYNKEFRQTLLARELPKLILTGQKDKVIVRPFVEDLIKDNGEIYHHDFVKGSHANLLRHNEDEYIALVETWLKGQKSKAGLMPLGQPQAHQGHICA